MSPRQHDATVRSLTCLRNKSRRKGSKDGKKNENEIWAARDGRSDGEGLQRASPTLRADEELAQERGRNEAGAGVLRVEKENRAKEGEADAFFAGM